MEQRIGKLIQLELYKQERTITWLARKLECSRNNVYNIFERDDIGVALVMRISRILRHNFFKDIEKMVDAQLAEENKLL